MLIKKRCSEQRRETVVDKRLIDIPMGTIFRYYDNMHLGPYLRITNGIVDMHSGQYYPYLASALFRNYKELPNAYLVTEEDEKE